MLNKGNEFVWPVDVWGQLCEMEGAGKNCGVTQVISFV